MTNIETAEVVHNWNFARDFPELPAKLIERPHMLETIVEILKSDTPIVFLEGEEGDGATTTLAQFCHAYPERSFSLFIKPASRFAYSLDYLRLSLAEQLHWYLTGNRLNEDTLDDSQFQTLLLKAQRKDRTSPLFFVIDGVHQIPAEDQRAISRILTDLLPIGVDRCRFIITGQQSILGIHLKGVKSKPYQQLKFRPEESREFLSDAGLKDSDYSTVHNLCRGIPGRLAAVRRLLLSGTSMNTILETDPSKYLEFVRLEFASLREMPEQQQMVVACVAFSKMSLTSSDLASLLTFPPQEINTTIARCQFLNLTGAGYIEFISETHRKFAKTQLESLSRKALTAQLEYLQKNPRSEVSLRFLPAYYETLNQLEAILALLSKEHYSDLLESTHSFAALRSRAELGVKSATNLHRTHEVFKFSLQRSIFSSVSKSEGDPARIEALVALGKTGEALALANAEATKEDRLDLLCAYARRVREKSGSIDKELLTLIQRLIGEVNFSELGDKAIKLAANVLFLDPDAAIGIIESAVKGATLATRDAALAELSFTASISKFKNRTKIEDKARPLISDNALQKVAHSFEVLSERLDLTELIEIVSKMPAAHQIYFLRSFIQLRKADARALDLVEYALDTIIRETEYTPRAKDLADLCTPFPFCANDQPRIRRLVARIDSQLGLVAKHSHSRELTVLQMRLAAAEHQYDDQKARDRIEQAYFDVSAINTPEVQLESLALMLGSLSNMDKDDRLELADGFRAVVKDDLNKLLNSILKDTGDHLSVVSPVLKALAADDCAAAIELVRKLNTEARRDSGHAIVASVIVTKPLTENRLQALRTSIESIARLSSRSQATFDLLGALGTNIERGAWLQSIETFRTNLSSATARGVWDTWMLKESISAGLDYQIEEFLQRIHESAERSESPIDEAHLYFIAAEGLSSIDIDKAKNLYDSGVKVLDKTAFKNKTTLNLFDLCLSLVSRSMAPLARANLLDEDKVSRFVGLVAQLPSTLTKVRILCEFSERLWCSRRKDLADRIIQEQIRPLLEQARLLDSQIHRQALSIAFPIFSTSHLKLTMPMVKDLESTEANNALYEAALLRLRKIPRADPDLNGKFDHSKIEASDIIDTLDILNEIDNDSVLFSLMRNLVNAVNDKLNRTKFSQTQKADWSATLREIVDKKLPDKRNIKHQGFKIASLALAYSLIETPFSTWENLEGMSEQIDNTADRCYVYLCLATSLPAKYNSHRKRFLEKALHLANRIPSPIDRLSHLQDYAEDAYANDAVASAKEVVRQAMKLSLEIQENAKTARHRRELIDFADQIDPGLANELIEAVDDDPARGELKMEAKKASSLAKAKRELANVKQIKDVDKCDTDMLPEAAWKNLAALEVGRLEPKSVELMTEFVCLSGKETLYNAYPVLSWHLENMALKYKSQQDVAESISPVCEALLLSTELTHAVIGKMHKRTNLFVDEDQDEGLLVRRKTREEAVRFIEDWIRRNADDYLKYCDAYFSAKDISLLRIFLAQAPTCKVYVVASKPHLIKEDSLSDTAFRKAWKEQCEQDPPETEVIALAYSDSERHVIHDRWLITKGAGLRLGTSFNSLGGEKLSEISEIDSGRAAAIEEQVDRYISKQRLIDGVKIQYTSFTLD